MGKDENFWYTIWKIFHTISAFFLYSTSYKDLKEFFFGLGYSLTKDKPKLRKFLSYSFINNIFAFGAVLPLFYLFEKNVVKSFRGALVLCTFSMFVDAFIEFKRKQLTSQHLSFD